MNSSLVSTIEIRTIRLWKRCWPLKWGENLPARFLACATKVGLLPPIWLEFERNLWMKVDIRDVLQGTLLLEGPWEPQTTQYIHTTLADGHVFLDIGANSGYFALLASRCVGPRGKVFAIEPNPAMAEQVRQNVARSGLTNVVVEELACSSSAGVRDLYLGPPGNTGITSLSSANVRSDECVSVNCVPADALVEKYDISRIDLVKIDVEGAELEVLRGMTDILKRFRPKIIIELLPSLLAGFSATIEDVTDQLARFGYSMSTLEGQHSNYLCTGALEGVQTPIERRMNV